MPLVVHDCTVLSEQVAFTCGRSALVETSNVSSAAWCWPRFRVIKQMLIIPPLPGFPPPPLAAITGTAMRPNTRMTMMSASVDAPNSLRTINNLQEYPAVASYPKSTGAVGGPADYESPVALRPRLATGLPFIDRLTADGAVSWRLRHRPGQLAACVRSVPRLTQRSGAANGSFGFKPLHRKSVNGLHLTATKSTQSVGSAADRVSWPSGVSRTSTPSAASSSRSASEAAKSRAARAAARRSSRSAAPSGSGASSAGAAPAPSPSTRSKSSSSARRCSSVRSAADATSWAIASARGVARSSAIASAKRAR